jgi:hypothetical protein
MTTGVSMGIIAMSMRMAESIGEYENQEPATAAIGEREGGAADCSVIHEYSN